MEEWNGKKRRALLIRIRLWWLLTAAQEHARLAGHGVEEIRDHRAMGRERAFRLTCRTGRVHDGRIIIRAEVNFWQTLILKVSPAIRLTNEALEIVDARIVALFFGFARDDDGFQIREAGHVLTHALKDLRVDNRDLHTGILEAVFKLLAGPP